ncbi:MAG: hypothetical protein V3V40_05440, partial [Nitrosomonadaceae bacterium]
QVFVSLNLNDRFGSNAVTRQRLLCAKSGHFITLEMIRHGTLVGHSGINNHQKGQQTTINRTD